MTENNEKEKWLGYARVSTPNQKLEVQIDKLNNLADARKWDIKIYSEKVSAIKERDEMNKCLEELFDNPEIKGIIVTHIDRLGRTVQQLSTLFVEMQTNNKQIICVDQAIDTTTTSGRLLYNMLSSIAEFERELIQERLAAGRARTGKLGGRPLKELPRDEILKKYRIGASFRYLGRIYGVSTSTMARRIRAWRKQIEGIAEGRKIAMKQG